MFTRYVFILALVVGVQGSWSSAQAPLSRAEQKLVERAKTLVETETGMAAEGLTLVSSEALEWNDASLGCPQPGIMYAQVVTPGYQIMLAGPNNETYDVHTADAPGGKLLLCTQAETSATKPFTPKTSTSEPSVTKPSKLEPLTGVVWQWQTDGLEDSSNYTLEFLADDTLVFQADCNRGRAHFEMFGENGLRIDAPATTRAACPPGSLEGTFIEQLVSSTAYALKDGNLLLYPVVAPGMMLFTPVSSADHTPEGEVSSQGSDSGGTPPTEPDRTFTFRCTPPDEAAFTFTVTFTAKPDPSEVALTLPERLGGGSLVLPQTRAADGARFEADGVVFWSKGDEALLEVDGQTFEGCTETAAAGRTGEVVFRAVGTEPFWSLELTEAGTLKFVYDLGAQEVIVSAPEGGAATERTTYHAVTEAHDLHIMIETSTCTDAMNGFAYEATVTVTLDGETFQGCGNRLE